MTGLFLLTDLNTAVTVLDISHAMGAFQDYVVVSVPVGDQLRLEGEVNGFGQAYSGDALGPTSYAFDGSATVNFDRLTPGVDLVTASGHDYSLPAGVPEPATWAMLILGLGAAGATLRGRRSLAVSGR